MKLSVKAFLFLAAFVPVLSCKKSNSPGDSGQTGNAAGLVTPVGTPDGTAETKVIGAVGGTFTTSDGRLTIDFPAGALSADNTISIQPITNNTPGGLGGSYRISPHNLNFAKPVKITFSYAAEDISHSLPDAVAIAYQDPNGIWQAVGNPVNDTAAKVVTVNTSHFSDWSMFQSLIMVPAVDFVDLNESITIEVEKVVSNGSDDALPFVPLGDTPLTDSIAADIKEWKLAGAGNLAPNKAHAVYTAPGSIPASNPVAVSAQLNSIKGQYFLVCNLYIGGEGATFRIDKGPWKHAVSPSGVITLNSPLGVIHSFNAVVPNSSKAGESVGFQWNGRPARFQFEPWSLQYPNFQYSYTESGNSILYKQYEVPAGTASAGGITFVDNGEASGLFYTGTFDVKASGMVTLYADHSIPPTFSNHRIDGFFKIKWGGN